jgi:hypothetical protein
MQSFRLNKNLRRGPQGCVIYHPGGAEAILGTWTPAALGRETERAGEMGEEMLTVSTSFIRERRACRGGSLAEAVAQCDLQIGG